MLNLPVLARKAVVSLTSRLIKHITLKQLNYEASVKLYFWTTSRFIKWLSILYTFCHKSVYKFIAFSGGCILVFGMFYESKSQSLLFLFENRLIDILHAITFSIQTHSNFIVVKMVEIEKKKKKNNLFVKCWAVLFHCATAIKILYETCLFVDHQWCVMMGNEFSKRQQNQIKQNTNKIDQQCEASTTYPHIRPIILWIIPIWPIVMMLGMKEKTTTTTTFA